MPPSEQTRLPTRTLFGLPFTDSGSIDVVAEHCLQHAARREVQWSCVVTPNVDHVVRYATSPAERAVALSATLVLPDGMPIVWASRLLGERLRSRLTGADLFAALVPRLESFGVSMLVVASSLEVAAALRDTSPQVHAIVAPIVDVRDEDAVNRLTDDIERELRATGAGICVIGLSMEKHHLFAARLRHRWQRDAGDEPRPTVMLLGGAPDMLVGAVPRAPRWMQRMGLEWLFRLVQDPRRLARRYLLDDPKFVVLVFREYRQRRRRREWP